MFWAILALKGANLKWTIPGQNVYVPSYKGDAEFFQPSKAWLSFPTYTPQRNSKPIISAIACISAKKYLIHCCRNENLIVLNQFVTEGAGRLPCPLEQQIDISYTHKWTSQAATGSQRPECKLKLWNGIWEGYQLIYIGKNNENHQRLVVLSNILKKYDSCPPTHFMETFLKAESQLINGSWWPTGLLFCRQDAFIFIKYTELNPYRRNVKSLFLDACPWNLQIRTLQVTEVNQSATEKKDKELVK